MFSSYFLESFLCNPSFHPNVVWIKKLDLRIANKREEHFCQVHFILSITTQFQLQQDNGHRTKGNPIISHLENSNTFIQDIKVTIHIFGIFLIVDGAFQQQSNCFYTPLVTNFFHDSSKSFRPE